jgi:methylated-DNA-[protein]-cysteine S-methyltransferase
LEEKGTVFQNKVWKELVKIPYGQTISYRTLAERLGDVKKIRAAASANGKNPFMLLVPCHRVLGIDGKMVGYAGGIDRKRKLIVHEQSKIVQNGLLF